MLSRRKVVLTLCDPVDRFERRLHGQFPNEKDVRKAFKVQLEDEHSRPVSLAKKWRAWHHVFTSRILFTEKTQLSRSETWRKLAEFLQIHPYPKSAVFARYNSRGGPEFRSSLCKEHDLLQDLKETRFFFLKKRGEH